MKKDIAQYKFFVISTRREDRFFRGRETSDRVISQSSSKQCYVRKFNPAMYAEHNMYRKKRSNGPYH
jgi:hypothetical protein